VGYQDALFKGKTLKGGRSCEERWDMIAAYIPRSGMMLDVGSDLGYFSIRAALGNPELAVISLEAEETSTKTQSKVIQSHELTTICLLQGMLNSVAADCWSRRTDWFDLTLVLSISHWFDNPASVLRSLSMMSDKLVVELLDPADHGACGQEKIREYSDPLLWLQGVTGRRCHEIGRCGRHTSEHPSHLILVEGPTDLNSRSSFWDSRIKYPTEERPILHFDGEIIRFKASGETAAYQTGCDLSSLMKVGRLVYPRKEYWFQSMSKALQDSDLLPDPIAHNMSWSASGITLRNSAWDEGKSDKLFEWQLGGVTECSGEAADNRRAAHRLVAQKRFAKMVGSWSKGASVESVCDTVDISSTRLWKQAKFIIRSALPETWVTAIKRVSR
jgi:hypothetical protein